MGEKMRFVEISMMEAFKLVEQEDFARLYVMKDKKNVTPITEVVVMLGSFTKNYTFFKLEHFID